MSIISYNKNLAILNVKAIDLNLGKSHLNRRKLRKKVTAETEVKKKKDVTKLQAV